MFSRFNRNMNSKADTNIYLLIIVLLAILVCYLQPKLIIPALIIFGIIYYFSRQNLINREIFFSSYLDNIIRNIERTNICGAQAGCRHCSFQRWQAAMEK